jgi:hypothetical protein
VPRKTHRATYAALTRHESTYNLTPSPDPLAAHRVGWKAAACAELVARKKLTLQRIDDGVGIFVHFPDAVKSIRIDPGSPPRRSSRRSVTGREARLEIDSIRLNQSEEGGRRIGDRAPRRDGDGLISKTVGYRSKGVDYRSNIVGYRSKGDHYRSKGVGFRAQGDVFSSKADHFRSIPDGSRVKRCAYASIAVRNG